MTEIRYTQGGITYTTLEHNYKCYWTSEEDGVKEGDVRVIDGILFKSWSVEHHGWLKPDTIRWSKLKIKIEEE